ncbi:DUF947-domain-containing protein [Coprinopsis marcescibilis]|uniref:rRNA biogenesis protein RRP36 n=1 Tax=Coprinopsis marcescibilis TaxID=230819 RepID=A0A5C3LCN3_COPMA|nr:DUF947-domain-containing protein [Coprinopsis marcescibilis]
MPSKSLATKISFKVPSQPEILRKRSRNEEYSSSSDFEEGSSLDGLSEEEESDSDLEEDANSDDPDAPRLAQWEADDDSIYDNIAKEEFKQAPSQLSELEDTLGTLPLGALRKAQKALKQVQPDSDSDSDSDSEGSVSGPDDESSAKEKRPQKVEWISKDTAKHPRSSKHAPMEVTSKRPVSRKRIVVETPKLVARDPRFLPTAGEFKPELFQQSYSFLTDSHKSELNTLRESLAAARKSMASCPAHLRPEREHEIERLERAVKRAESLVNRDRQEAIQQQALKKVASEEKDKQKSGKGIWYLKKEEKDKLIQKARFEALSADGGHRAVKKAIERKQKKISQKEKKSRPYAKGAGLEASGSYRRKVPSSSFESRPNKKPRVL